MKFVLLVLFFTTIGISTCFSQSERVEAVLMDCWYDALGDDRLKVQELIDVYEELLIKEGILQDGDSKSYKSTLETVVKNREYKRPSKSFYAQLEKMGLSLKGYNECKDKVVSDSLKYNALKLKHFESVFDSILRLDEYTRADVAHGILSVLNEKDFDFVYYRVRTFLIYDLIILSEYLDSKF